MKLVRDNLHGFSERPHYQPIELETMFEKIVTDFLKKKYGRVECDDGDFHSETWLDACGYELTDSLCG